MKPAETGRKHPVGMILDIANPVPTPPSLHFPLPPTVGGGMIRDASKRQANGPMGDLAQRGRTPTGLA